MLPTMMESQLSIADLIEHAGLYHPHGEIVSRCVEGGIHRYTYQDSLKRIKKLANALLELGVKQGDCVATLAWNTYRHFELYYAISGVGAITHTINPRLFAEQITYIINHAEDRIIFVDLTFVALLEEIKDQITAVQKIVVMTDRQNMPTSSLELICYEELIAPQANEFEWQRFDETTPAALCYTSGTTGNPKGVLYTHRSTLLHAYCAAQVLKIDCLNVILPVVPMFHVGAWGIPYFAPQSGCKLVMPGAGLDGKALYELIDAEQVDCLVGVPTVWLNLLNHLRETGQKLTSVSRTLVGGAAAPLSMIREFQQQHDVFLLHGWGMTEMSPVGTVNCLTPEMAKMPLEERYQAQLRQGKPVFGVQLKIVDDQGNELPRDGKSFGRLLTRGPWIANSYFKNADRSSWVNGWFDTGDVATLSPDGYMQIVDRSKDVIKSGGEWISSMDLENAAMGHAAVKEACVIGVPHPKWNERPLLLVTTHQATSKESIMNYLSDKVAKWWLPDDIIFVDELPHNATGKLYKLNLRQQYKDHLS